MLYCSNNVWINYLFLMLLIPHPHWRWAAAQCAYRHFLLSFIAYSFQLVVWHHPQSPGRWTLHFLRLHPPFLDVQCAPSYGRLVQGTSQAPFYSPAGCHYLLAWEELSLSLSFWFIFYSWFLLHVSMLCMHSVIYFYQFCSSLCPSNAGFVFKRMHVSSHFLYVLIETSF